MAENDIYNSKRRYESFVNNLIKNKKILEKPDKNSLRIYYCKNKDNLKYYDKLLRIFEVDDLSYIRRIKLLNVLTILCYHINLDLKKANSVEKEEVILNIRKTTKPSQLKKFEADIKRIGNVLFEDKDKPDFFKTFKIKVDRSTQKAREDKLTYEEFDSIVKFFSNDDVMQCYLTIAFETLVRPQELLFTKINDLEIKENYAIINISSHGKEGIKKLLVIDSFPYLIKMFNQHKNKKNSNAFLFLNEYKNQLTPFAINKKIKNALRVLEINKPITCYSLKRFGVTFRRLRGDDDVTIQRIANWTSTKQLKTYDQSNQDDVFQRELAKRGLIKDEKFKQDIPKTKTCDYCNTLIGFAEDCCPKCLRVVNKELIKKELIKQEDMIKKLELFNKFFELHKEDFENILNKAKEKKLLS